MRRILLSGTFLASVVLTGPSPAAAQGLPVIDATSIGTQIQNQIQVMAQWVKEFQAWGQQYAQMAQQIQQLIAIYNVVHQVTDIGSAVGALQALGVNNPLPVNPWAVQSLLAGQNTGFSGISGAISGLANQSWGANHYFTPTDGSLASQLLIDRANGAAGYSGVAGGLYQSIADRMPLLRSLHDRLVTSTDIKQTADLQARYQIEADYVQGQVAQLQATQAMANAQNAAFDNKQAELLEKSLSDQIAQGQAHGY